MLPGCFPLKFTVALNRIGAMKTIKRAVALLFLLTFAGAVALAQQAVVPGNSNTRDVSQGFERNDYDFLLDPARMDLLSGPTLFLALDNAFSGFAEDFVGDGFRLGWANPELPFAPNLALNYFPASSTAADPDEENTDTQFNNFTDAPPQYATITDSLGGRDSSANRRSGLFVHVGGTIADGIGLAAQVRIRRTVESILEDSGEDIFVDTIEPNDTDLSEIGDRIVHDFPLVYRQEAGGVFADLELGLQLPTAPTRVVVSLQLQPGIDSADLVGTRTVEAFDGGADAAILDTRDTTQYRGAWLVDNLRVTDATPVLAVVDMDTNFPAFFESTAIGLFGESQVELNPEYALDLSGGGSYRFAPEGIQSIRTLREETFDDSIIATPVLTDDVTTVTSSSLDSATILSANLGATLRKSRDLDARVSVHLGIGLSGSYEQSAFAMSETEVVTTLIDGDNDQLYETAGVDTNQVVTFSGYTTSGEQTIFIAELLAPVAFAYEPLPGLRFRAGIQMGLNYNRSVDVDRETGDPNYTTQTIVDALDAGNNVIDQTIPGSDSLTFVSTARSSNFVPTSSATFGFTLDLNDQVTIDARASSAQVSFGTFNVAAIYRY